MPLIQSDTDLRFTNDRQEVLADTLTGMAVLRMIWIVHDDAGSNFHSEVTTVQENGHMVFRYRPMKNTCLKIHFVTSILSPAYEHAPHRWLLRSPVHGNHSREQGFVIFSPASQSPTQTSAIRSLYICALVQYPVRQCDGRLLQNTSIFLPA
jgi:hypothetical protein